MKRMLAIFALLATALAQSPAPKRDTYLNLAQGAVVNVPNTAGSQAVSFEYLFSATPAAVSITIAGCMRGTNPNPGAVGTCDAAADTYTGTTNSIRAPSFTKVYDTFQITVGTLTGATVTINTTIVVSKAGTGSGGSGSGTVNNGTINQLAIYPATGTTVQGDALLTDNGTTLTYTGTGGILATAGPIASGANGGAAGVVKGFGSTSGSATFTWPAVAGTISNPIVASNALQTASELQSYQAATTGILRLGSDGNCFIQRNASNIQTFNCGSSETFNDDIIIAPAKRFIMAGAVVIHSTAPTIAGAGCGGSGATITAGSGTAGFAINVGTTPGSACTITMPSASNTWICQANDITTNSSAVFLQKQTGAVSTTSVTITNFNTAAAATAFVASDVVNVSCTGR